MVVLFIILSLIGGFILWLIFSPFYIKVNTEYNQYQLTMPAVFKLYYQQNESPGIKIKFLFFTFSPEFKKNKKQNDNDRPIRTKNAKKKQKRALSPRIVAELVKKIFKSFKINRLQATIDTGDYTLNSHLIPIVLLAGIDDKININYYNINHADLEIRGNLYKFLYLGMWFIIKRKQ